MTRAVMCMAALLILLSPFGEGGRAAWALAGLHTLAIVFCLTVATGAPARRGWRLPDRGMPRVMLLCVLFAALAALVASLGAGYPYAAMLGLLDRWIIAALLVAAIGLAASDNDRLILRNLVVLSTGLQAVVAIARGIDGGASAAGALFLNPNHLAAYLNIGLFCCAAALTRPPWRPRGAALWGGLALLHVAAILILESRGALLGLLGGCLLLLAVRWRDWSPRARRIAAESLLLVTLIGGGTLALRFMRADDPFRYHRLSIWQASAGMIAQEPLLGHGPGMFRHASPAYNFPLREGPIRYGRNFHGAHSSILTLAAEDGVPAALITLTALVLAIVILLRRGRNGRGRDVDEGIGVALSALVLQGLVEDLLERPAFGIVMALLVGTAIGARRIDAPADAPRPDPGPMAPAAVKNMVWRFRLAATTAALVIWGTGILLPYLAHRDATAARAGGRRGLERMERAARLNPYQPEYQHDLAMARINQGEADARAYAGAMDRLQRARRLKPIDPRFPVLMARLEVRFGDTLFDDPLAGERAAALYREAVRLAPLDPRPRLEEAGHLADLGRLEEALESLQAALELEPRFRRARLLQVSLLVQLERPDDTNAAWEALRVTDAVLEAYSPDSSYAADLTRDAPRERERLVALLSGRPESISNEGTH